jgi:hypothetical protein
MVLVESGFSIPRTEPDEVLPGRSGVVEAVRGTSLIRKHHPLGPP